MMIIGSVNVKLQILLLLPDKEESLVDDEGYRGTYRA
jgi:hypothetical protein